jgi:hypothetical protein
MTTVVTDADDREKGARYSKRILATKVGKEKAIKKKAVEKGEGVEEETRETKEAYT